MKTPDEITHNGQTYERLPDNSEAREGDLVMISGKLFNTFSFLGELRINLGEGRTLIPSVLEEIAQAYYREKRDPEPEAFELIDIMELRQSFEEQRYSASVHYLFREVLEQLESEVGK